MAELLTVRWDQHKNSLTNSLQQLRLQGIYSDVTLACDGQIYHLHKIILSVFSDYFARIFTETSSPTPVIMLRDTTTEDLEALLDYMYVGEVKIEEQKLNSFLKSGEYLRVKGLASSNTNPIPVVAEKRTLTTDNTVCQSKKQKICPKPVEVATSVIPSPAVAPNKKKPVPQFERDRKRVQEDLFIESGICNSGFDIAITRRAEKRNLNTSSSQLKSKSVQTGLKESHTMIDNHTNEFKPPSASSELDTAHASMGVLEFSEDGNVFVDKNGAPLRCPETVPITIGTKISSFESLRPETRVAKTCRKLLICPYCSQKFNSSSDIETHVRTHTFDKPYSCPHCPKRGTIEATIAQHMSEAHNDNSKIVLKQTPQWRLVKGCTSQAHHLLYH